MFMCIARLIKFFFKPSKKELTHRAEIADAIMGFHDSYNNINKYISKSESDHIEKTYKDLYNSIKKSKYNKWQGINVELFDLFKSAYEDITYNREKHNKEFIANEKINNIEFFSNINGLKLDDSQQTAVITDEDHNLVVASAGSGKTLTIVGKVKYLCEKQHILPEDILLISFTKKAAEEMSARLKKCGIKITSQTFHKLGLDIISSHNKKRPDVLDESGFSVFINDFFKNTISKQPQTLNALSEFFSYYLEVPEDADKFNSLGEFFEHNRGTNLETLKSKYEYKRAIKSKAKKYETTKRTLQGEIVKSSEELMIANFLFAHGVAYEYERLYPYETNDQYRKQYRPDFYLKDYDIYLEHFGINKDGKCPQLSTSEEHKYLEDMEWKHEIHKRNNTKLIETFSWYQKDGILLEKLAEILSESGVKLQQPDYVDIYKNVYNDATDECFKSFINLCSTFINLFKAKGLKKDDLDEILDVPVFGLSNSFMRTRQALFKDIITNILDSYEKFLKKQKKIDFSDMIITATDIVREYGSTHDYKYIIIDEFQDSSISRFNLIDAIIKQTGAHLLCVGDDWQSIYRFSGADVGLFTDFEKNLPGVKIMKIEKTYRNSQELVNAAADFVMQNPAQIEKHPVSDKHCACPITFYLYRSQVSEPIEKALNDFISRYGKTKNILILGRTNNDKKILPEDLFKVYNSGKVVYSKAPDIDIKYMTVHKSKGLEADNVIILNFINDKLGFPNKIEDDKILSLVLSSSDSFLYAEERRLLYVALTRTKNEVALITHVDYPSEFYRDFDGSKYVKSVNVDFVSKEEKISCPKCRSGHLLIRQDKKNNKMLVGCSNYPQCDFLLRDIAILKNERCPLCGGFLIKRKGFFSSFWGCSYYPHCKYTKKIDEPKQEMS